MDAVPPERRQVDDDDFTFPTPPPPQRQVVDAERNDMYRHHLLPTMSCSPVCRLHLSTPIRRSFSAASPWRDDRASVIRRCCSPALTDSYYCDAEQEEEEERMDSLWEDLNDDDAARDDLFRRSVGSAKEERGSRSSWRRQRRLVAMMRALKTMFVAHKQGKSSSRDEQSRAVASASASPSL